VTDSSRSFPADVQHVLSNPARLEAVAALLSDEPGDADFARLARMAAQVLGTSSAVVALLGEHQQHVLGHFGPAPVLDLPGGHSVGAHALALEPSAALIVSNAAEDTRFDPSTFAEHPNLRFCAGASITVGNQKVGAIYALDQRARDEISPMLGEQLVELAHLAASLCELKSEARVSRRTAAALMREEWRHALTLEAGQVGSWVWDVPSGELTCNDMFRRMYDLPEDTAIQVNDVLAATHPADTEKLRAAIRASFDEGVDFEAEARSAASNRWLTMRGRVYQRDAEGKPLVMMGAAIDVSESKLTAEHTRLLLRELNHRVKNTLAMIQSVARQTIRQNPDPQDFIDAFSGRLRTISDAHVLLADRDWSGVQLFEVIGSQLGPRFRTNPDRADIKGDDVALPADHALGLGLILHELTTNAHRHGAWAGPEGVVQIKWDVVEEPVRGLSLTWRETGGPQVTPPKEVGLGTRLIERSLAKVLDSEVKLSFEPEGVVARVWMPLPEQQV
jgi:two-component sensor histidine kinase